MTESLPVSFEPWPSTDIERETLRSVERRLETSADPLDRARLLLRAASARIRLGQGAKAAARLSSAVALLVQSGLHARAEAAICWLLRIHPRDPNRLARLGRATICELPCSAARLLVEAARSHYARGELQAAASLLEALEAEAPELPREMVATLADAWREIGHEQRALPHFVDAAERARIQQSFREAAALCHRAAAVGAASTRLHRTWALALLGLDDPACARSHLEAWTESQPESLEGRIWQAETLFALGHHRATQRILHQISQRIQVGQGEHPNGACLKREIVERLRSERALMESRVAPFWEADELFRDSAAAEDAGKDRPLVFLAEDTHVYRTVLSTILADAGLDVTLCPDGVPFAEALVELPRTPDVLILPIRASEAATLEQVRRIRGDHPCRETPILGFTTVCHGRQDLAELRSVGVSGVVDNSCIPETIVWRVNQLVREPRERRRFERAPTFMPVDLSAEGVVTSEYALSLAVGGMRVTSSRPLPPNSDVQVRFQLPAESPDFMEVKGRVIYLRESSLPHPAHELGLFFYPMGDAERRRVEDEIERLLSAT